MDGQLLKIILIIALIVGGVYLYRNWNVTEYKVVVKETIKQEVQ